MERPLFLLCKYFALCGTLWYTYPDILCTKGRNEIMLHDPDAEAEEARLEKGTKKKAAKNMALS
jgi:hypothetical protein